MVQSAGVKWRRQNQLIRPTMPSVTTSNFFQMTTRAFIFFGLLTPFFAYSQLETDSLLSAYERLPDDAAKVDKINDDAYGHWNTQPLLTERLGVLSLELATRLSYKKGIANSNHILGIAQWAMDNYDQALRHFFQALTLYEELEEKRGVANIHLNIASVFDDLGEYQKARDYAIRSIALMSERGDTLGLARAYNNAGVIFEHLQQYDSAIGFLESAIGLRQALHDTIGVARGYNNVGIIYKYLGNRAMAMKYYKDALALNRGSADLNLKASTHLNLGEHFLTEKDFSTSLAHLDSGLHIAKAIDSKRSAQLAYQHLKNHALARGDYRQAFEYFSSEMSLDKERINEESSKKIGDLQLQYATEKSAKEIAVLENQRNQERFYRNLTLTGLAATLAIVIIVIFWFRFRLRKNKEVIETRHALTATQLENALLREKELTLELEQRKRELTAYTLNFVQKSELLTDLKESISKVQHQLPESYTRELNQLNRKVEESFRLDQDWENFKNSFEQVHTRFFTVLKQKCSDLTSNELKLCALLKLNFNLKEAAQIMGIAPESVKTARYRLKKKLGLGANESLVDFILMLEYPVPEEQG